MEAKSSLAFKIGLFLLVLSWFSFTLYELGKSILNGVSVPFTDVPGTIGLAFRTAASFTSLIIILFYLFRRDLSTLEVVTSFRWIVLFEAVYYAFFLPSAIWGFQYSNPRYPSEFIIVETALPCLVEAAVMPILLGVLFLKLSPKKPAKGAIKWGLIAAAANIFVLWLNYTAQWWAGIILSGTSFIVLYPANALGFILTVGGLLLLALYACVYIKESNGAEALARLNPKKAGMIITALGLYFDITLLLWLLFGSPSGLTIWSTFFVYHNVDLWMLLLPLAGLPLLFSKKNNE